MTPAATSWANAAVAFLRAGYRPSSFDLNGADTFQHVDIKDDPHLEPPQPLAADDSNLALRELRTVAQIAAPSKTQIPMANISNLLHDPTLLRNQAYVDGEWLDASSGQALDVINPATEALVGTVPLMGQSETQVLF